MSYGGTPAGTTAPAAGSSSTNVLAIIALVVGILALLPLCIFAGPVSLILGIVAAVLGYMGRNQIRQRGQGGSGLAMAGLVIGIVAAVLGLLELAGLAAIIGLGGNAIQTAVSLTATAVGK